MRPLSLRHGIAHNTLVAPWAFLTLLAALPGCAEGGASSGSNPPPPPPAITVSVTHPTGSVLLGRTLQLTATVSGTTNKSVVWSVNGTNGGNSSHGTISPAGLYSAPADLPFPASVQITAASTASPPSTRPGDLSVIAKQPAGLGIIHLTLQLDATAQPGARTFFFQNLNLDKTASSGVVEVQ